LKKDISGRFDQKLYINQWCYY